MTINDAEHITTIGRYEILGILGQGGMGAVYKAIMPTTEKIVALKYLNPREALVAVLDMDTIKTMFIDEAVTMADLRHPYIADIWDFDYDNDGIPFFTMEYYCNTIGALIGEHYTVERASRVIAPEKMIDYGCQILEGLRCMHHAGVIHRDVKPYNIMLTDQDSIKICDFGMSKQLEGRLTSPDGLMIGSPYYTAPEQNRNPDNADQRSDLYSTGVLLYRMLTGELPFMKSFALSRVNPVYDATWDDFFEKALNWQPEERFQDAGEMSEALRTLGRHLQKHKERACRDITTPDHQRKDPARQLRADPVRVAGTEAKACFEVDDLFQPQTYSKNQFTETGLDTVLDRLTDLVWQRTGSDYPLNRAGADLYIAFLNEKRFAGLSTWRLPTVNELLSLVNDPSSTGESCGPALFTERRFWFWSSDRRSEKTAWHVNVQLGYTGWQEQGCHYFVKAVCRPKPTTP